MAGVARPGSYGGKKLLSSLVSVLTSNNFYLVKVIQLSLLAFCKAAFAVDSYHIEPGFRSFPVPEHPMLERLFF